MAETESSLDDNLPSILEETATQISLPTPVSTKDTLSQVKAADLEVANSMLAVMYAGLGKAKSIASLCKLADSTMSILERRRKLLCMQYGAPNNLPKTQDFEPLD